MFIIVVAIMLLFWFDESKSRDVPKHECVEIYDSIEDVYYQICE